MSTTPSMSPDAHSVEAFADRIMNAALGWVEISSIHLGAQLGWYDALRSGGPSTPDQLATSTGTNARYAREWLEQQAASGILEVEEDGRFRLPEAAAEVLLDVGSLSFLEPLARMLAAAGTVMPALVEAYRSGSGVSWEQLGAHARESQAEMNRPWFDSMPAVLAGTPRIDEVLRRPGARVADIGMGGGWSSIALAQAYPGLQVEGYDIDQASVELARANATAAGVTDRVGFVREDAARLADHGPFDAVFAFECLHDMPHPVEVLRAAREAVRPDGVVIIMDEAAAEEFAPEADELERLLYGFSLFVCLPDGMSHRPSAATGTVMRPATLRDYARQAGWNDIRVVIPEFGLWRFYELV